MSKKPKKVTKKAKKNGKDAKKTLPTFDWDKETLVAELRKEWRNQAHDEAKELNIENVIDPIPVQKPEELKKPEKKPWYKKLFKWF